MIGYNPYDPNVGRNPMNPVSTEGGQANFKKKEMKNDGVIVYFGSIVDWQILLARKSKLLLMMNNKREREFFYPRRC